MASLVDLALVVASILLIVGGITYWLYSTIDQQGRKIGILENVLYELRYAIQNRPEPRESSEPVEALVGLEEEEHSHSEEPHKSVKLYSAPPEPLDEEIDASMAEFDLVKDDTGHDMLGPGRQVTASEDMMRPGGGIELDEDAIMNNWESNKEEKFKSLFEQPSAQTKDVDMSAPVAQRTTGASAPQTLESMTLKDLRNLAVGRKISGAKSMKRAELIEALQGGSSSSSGSIDESIPVSGPVPISD